MSAEEMVPISVLKESQHVSVLSTHVSGHCHHQTKDLTTYTFFCWQVGVFLFIIYFAQVGVFFFDCCLSFWPKCAKFITFIDNICRLRDQSNPDQQQYQSFPFVTQSPSPPPPPRPKYGAKRAEEKEVDIKWVLKDEPVFPLAWLLGCTIQWSVRNLNKKVATYVHRVVM